MAWISVHEQVIGGKLRKLAKEIGCSQNEALGLLIRLWLWGINNADKEGRIIGATGDDIAEVLTIGIDSKYSPERVVDALVDTGWIDVQGDLFIHDWEEWQRQWYKALETRERDAVRKRKQRANDRAKKDALMDEANVKQKESGEEELPMPRLKISSQETTKSRSISSYSASFETLWGLYPRKVGKAEAYKKYKARLNDGWSEAELMEAVRNYADRVARERTEEKYIKHAKTFFSENTPFADFLSRKGSDDRKEERDDDDPYGDWR